MAFTAARILKIRAEIQPLFCLGCSHRSSCPAETILHFICLFGFQGSWHSAVTKNAFFISYAFSSSVADEIFSSHGVFHSIALCLYPWMGLAMQ
jgi:hypothetical protein